MTGSPRGLIEAWRSRAWPSGDLESSAGSPRCLIEAGCQARCKSRGRRRHPRVVPAASLKRLDPSAAGNLAARHPRVVPAASLKQSRSGTSRGGRQRHPRVVPAASLKPEARQRRRAVPDASSAGSPRGLIEAGMCEVSRTGCPGHPRVVPAASLKRKGVRGSGAGGRVIRG